jgi:hypothetical protein
LWCNGCALVIPAKAAKEANLLKHIFECQKASAEQSRG